VKNEASVKGPIAQRLEQATHNRLVGGSNPSGPTIPKTPHFPNNIAFYGALRHEISVCAQPLLGHSLATFRVIMRLPQIVLLVLMHWMAEYQLQAETME
jgi:hypothetical protein